MSEKTLARDAEQTIMLEPILIHPAAENERRAATQNIDELAMSISSVGQLQPIIVRRRSQPGTKGNYEIVCGERRWRACQKLGRPVAAVVMELSDGQAQQIRTIENLQREDPAPLEQSRDINKLLALGLDVHTIAEKIGKSIAWVAQLAKLRDLAPSWQEAVVENRCKVQAWSGAHLAIIARFDAAIQDTLCEQLLQEWEDVAGATLKDLEHEVAHFMLDLRSVPWSLDDEKLCPDAGACATCSKRTGCVVNLDLFADETAKGKKVQDRCLDKACYGRKQAACVEAKVTALRAQNPDIVLLDQGSGSMSFLPKDHPLKSAAVSIYHIDECKKTDKGARQAVVVDGAGAGQTKWIRSSHGSEKAIPVKGQKKPMAERKEALEKRRRLRFIVAVIELLEHEKKKPEMVVAAAKDTAHMVALAITFGISADGDVSDEWKKTESMRGRKDLYARLLLSLCDTWIRTLQGYANYGDGKHGVAFSEQICELLTFDAVALHGNIKAEIPEPASWAREREEAKLSEKIKGKKAKAARRCRVCGCTENNCRQCIEKTGAPCTWVEEDLCSACADEGRSIGKTKKAKSKK